MTLFINGQKVNPILSFITTAVVTAGLIALGIFLLPIIGGVLLFLLFIFGCIVLYGMYYRWRYGDPFKRMQEQFFRTAQYGAASRQESQGEPSRKSSESPCVIGSIKRKVEVEDAVVVEEVRRRNSESDN